MVRSHNILASILAAGVLFAASSGAVAQATQPAGQSTTGQAQQPVSVQPLRAVVTLPALKSFVEPFLPPGSEIVALMKPGKSEHNYEFSAGDLAQLARADIVVIVGVGLEPQVEQFLERHRKPGRQEVSFGASVGIQQEENAAGTPHVHDDGSTCTHAHGVDPHLWLDPVLVRGFVPAIRSAVTQAQSVKAKALGTSVATEERRRLDLAQAQLLANVNAVHDEHVRALTPLAGRAIVTHHDAFGRLAKRYGLVVAASIKNTHAGEATPERIAEAVRAIKARDAKAVFFEPQFDKSVAERIATTAGVKLGMLDPLGDGDWFAMMRSNLRTLAENLSDKADGTHSDTAKPAAPTSTEATQQAPQTLGAK